MPLILVTNDDGVQSEGLKTLFSAMQDVGDAIIVAPDREKSAVSHALTMHRPLKADRIDENIYSVNGTPTDCVVLAVGKILPERPDMIVSGINRGANLGDDITYSGTVSAAIEGTLFGIPSIAVSMILHGEDFDRVGGEKAFNYETAAIFIEKLARFVLNEGLPPDTLLNVNVPNVIRGEVKGIKYTRQGKRVYDNAIHETFDPWGLKHFWIGGGTPSWQKGNDTDFNAVDSGYVSITPIHLDLTNYDALSALREGWDGRISIDE